MPETTFEKITRTASRSIDNVGQSLPWLVLSLIKLSLVALFFCYLLEFANEFSSGSSLPGKLRAVLAAVIGVLCLVFIAIGIFSGMREEWNAAAHEPQKGGLWPFVALVLFPVIIVAIADHWFSYSFKSQLLKETQDRINQFLAWI